ncbi:hypothetical protein KCH_38400 [Kitasatospora cheerisanensis KCTC 2395]|uniref:Uncharacterized protein n=1 Tax=Kitasatospora cheerisanensis KCTC 2395 TaxID=1348663 RepID=A0A066YVN4_9ACTN|nr:hypothetical protein KCH_38400 [Kitasatospora cheerisanensis KCTC 2395]
MRSGRADDGAEQEEHGGGAAGDDRHHQRQRAEPAGQPVVGAAAGSCRSGAASRSRRYVRYSGSAAARISAVCCRASARSRAACGASPARAARTAGSARARPRAYSKSARSCWVGPWPESGCIAAVPRGGRVPVSRR